MQRRIGGWNALSIKRIWNVSAERKERSLGEIMNYIAGEGT